MPYVFTLPMIRLAFTERQLFDLPLSYRYQGGEVSALLSVKYML